MKVVYLVLAGALLILTALFSCLPANSRVQLIRQVVHPARTPAGFDTTIIYLPHGSGYNLKYIWSCDSGTVRGGGNMVSWSAPVEPGHYEIKLKITDGAGNEESRIIIIDTYKFDRAVYDARRTLSLQFPLLGNALVAETICLAPATTMEIDARMPWEFISSYKFNWSSNGGKIVAPGLKDGTANRIGWTSPGMGGCYTVRLIATDRQDNYGLGLLYVYVKMPYCGDNCEIYPVEK